MYCHNSQSVGLRKAEEVLSVHARQARSCRSLSSHHLQTRKVLSFRT